MTKPLTPLRRKDQATGYQAAVRDIVAWLRSATNGDDTIKYARLFADEIKDKFGGDNGQ